MKQFFEFILDVIIKIFGEDILKIIFGEEVFESIIRFIGFGILGLLCLWMIVRIFNWIKDL